MSDVWCIYVLRCADDSLYCGITTDTDRRLKEHNGNGKKGAKYTRSRRPVILFYEEAYPDRSSAAKSESKFKKLTRKKKLQYMVNQVTLQYENAVNVFLENQEAIDPKS